jgi:hypothetical protein
VSKVEVYSPKPTKTKRKSAKKIITKIQEEAKEIDTSNGFLFETTGHFMDESFVIENVNPEVEESIEEETSLFLDMSQLE